MFNTKETRLFSDPQLRQDGIEDLVSAESASEARADWRAKRIELEQYQYHRLKYRYRRFVERTFFEKRKSMFYTALRRFPFYESGYQNAGRIILRRISITMAKLPRAFHGYRMLHLTDPHMDSLEGFADAICEAIRDIACDLCLFSGDYIRNMGGPFDQILLPMKQIIDSIDARDGILATLGNHDTHHMVEVFEEMGLRMLNNESVNIRRGNDAFVLTGVDDPHLYLTDQSRCALKSTPDAFKIVMAHSPELYDTAAEAGYNLYLCGHTHGGQICLPGGIPLVTHLKKGKRFYRGLWRYREMVGFTNQGCGVVGFPVRYNTESEIALITLRRG